MELNWVSFYLGASALFSFATAITLWDKRIYPAAIPLGWFAFFAGMWSLTYSLELRSVEFVSKLFWLSNKFIYISLIPVAIAVFVLRFTGRPNWPSFKLLIALLIIPVITMVMVFTNTTHSLFYQLDPERIMNSLPMQTGPWFWVHTVYSYSLIISSISIGFTNMAAVWQAYRYRIWVLIFALAMPFLANVYRIAGFSFFGGIDLTPLALGLSIVFVFFSVHTSGLLTVLPFAYETIVLQMRDGLLLLDQTNRIVHVNRAAEKILELSAKNLLGLKPAEIDHQAFRLLNIQAMNGDTFVFDVKLGDEENPRWYDVGLSTITTPSRTIIGRITVWRDITERKLSEQKLHFLSTHDQLTGLYNRLFYETEYERMSHGRQWPVTLMMIDLDHMKATNDHFGHQAGDDLLRQAASLLKASFRADDILARIGGDEFAGLLPGCSEQDAAQLVQRIELAIQVYNDTHPKITVEFSLGWAVAKTVDELPEALQLADARMYAEKNRRRNLL